MDLRYAGEDEEAQFKAPRPLHRSLTDITVGRWREADTDWGRSSTGADG
jgi:hypothetical protein